ncbi:MAG TPA: 3',5'-nucleoside bisphosphate phosphatase [Casimicrobiaceae bacterium]
MIQHDLHCHSTYSDGVLAPSQVVRRAALHGVDVLALTDHDELQGLAEARAAAADEAIELVPGSELSVTWEGHTIHVVALRIDPDNETLIEGLAAIRAGRDARAQKISDALQEAGIPDALEGARRYVTSQRLISRTHFARFLADAGHVRDVHDAFKRYLVAGKPGYVPHAWATLTQALGWIAAAGGQAVLAHPGRYSVSREDMRRLLEEFRDSGGDAIEIISPSHTAAQSTEYARYARVFGFKGSCGSDFHAPDESADFGALPPLPAGVEPVWSTW